MNSVAEIKSGLHHYIAETNDVKTLNKLQKFVDKLLSEEERVVANTFDGETLNPVTYKKDIDIAIIEAEIGKVVSIEEMEKGL